MTSSELVIATVLGSQQQDPWWVYPAVLAGMASIVALLWMLGRILDRLFPGRKTFTGAGGNALMRIESLFSPSRQHVIEVREFEAVENDEEGDPPKAGPAQ